MEFVGTIHAPMEGFINRSRTGVNFAIRPRDTMIVINGEDADEADSVAAAAAAGVDAAAAAAAADAVAVVVLAAHLSA